MQMWRVFDLSGKTVRSGRINTSEWQIELGDLQKGVYFVQISDADGRTYSQKLIRK